jgi:hypothetical protein
MRKVRLLLRNTVVGWVELYADVPTASTDFRCDPPGIVSLARVQVIVRALVDGQTAGQVERYQWQLESEPG